jgi:alkanesulfonate monooxygenase SsuD/methylene tetrahydromethanopterin reductase-like flavin-dependent oxidoreductase (luciferase family)
MSVGVTRSINVVMTPADKQKAFENRIAARRRIDRLTIRPDGKNQKRMLSDEAICAGALYGTPDEIAAKLETLRAAGAEYVLLNSAGGPASLRRFAHEVRPSFADVSTLQPA